MQLKTKEMKRSDCVALMIGRGGSSLKDKNILSVLGRPLLHYPAIAAKHSKYIGRFYISSDCDKILSSASEVGYERITRPIELAGPNAQSSDAVFHAIDYISKNAEINYLVVQHANVGTITTDMIDDCLDLLFSDERLSAVIPSHYNNEYHPYRASFVKPDGTLKSLSEDVGEVSANRQSLPECVFFDHSFWAINLVHIRKHGLGDGPWPCMGQRIKPFIGSGCFDVHSMEDVAKTEAWLRESGVDYL